MQMLLDGKRLKRWLFPSSEEKKAQQIKEEIKRRERYQKESAQLGYKLTSLERQEKLAKQRAEIAEKQQRIARLQARATAPARALKPAATPAFSFEQNLFKDADNLAERLMGGKRRGR